MACANVFINVILKSALRQDAEALLPNHGLFSREGHFLAGKLPDGTVTWPENPAAIWFTYVRHPVIYQQRLA